MTTKILVIGLDGAFESVALPGVANIICKSAGEIVNAIASADAAVVLVSDLVAPAGLARVAEAVTRFNRPVIEVRSVAWDGVTNSPLSAACRGVISGFGADGVLAAVRLLQREAAEER